MLEWILDWLLTGVAILIIAAILPGVEIKNYGTALLVAILIALVDATLGWVLRILAWPFNLITFGLVYFIIYVLMIMLVDKLISKFHIRNFWWALLFAILLTISSRLIDWIL